MIATTSTSWWRSSASASARGGTVSLTGFGAVVGVPVAGVGVVAAAGGAGLVYVGTRGALEDLTTMMATKGSPSRGAYGDPGEVDAAATGKIGQGHGYEHVHKAVPGRAKQGVKFPGEPEANPASYAGTREDHQEIIDEVVATGDVKRLEEGRVGHWEDGVVVIYDPSKLDKGTCFMPDEGRLFFDTDLQ